MAESGLVDAGLRYSSPTHRALMLAYVLIVRNLNEEDRAEFDGWVTATTAQVAEWEQEQKKDRLDLIRSLGEMT